MDPTSFVIATGSELLTGELPDRNGPWLARALKTLGYPAAGLLCAPDDDGSVFRALEAAARAGAAVAALTGG
ncbi:MAG: molybdopterin-binding protein, partial [Planctomycetes bacterium]|nr:molybdopterin-binding protein [Planctomycetota bacterium]